MKFYLKNWMVNPPMESISHAALSCYEDQMPEWGRTISVEGAVFKTGHHTTIQHTNFTFFVEGIAVGDVTFGLHLASTFCNTDQRSGRFCAQMFSSPDYSQMIEYVRNFWHVDAFDEQRILDYIKGSIAVYKDNIQKATTRADEFIKEERPNANEKYRQQNSPKIAQEQLRMFVPVIFPTGLEFTINLSVLVAMYRSAWSPVMKDATKQMRDLVVGKWPELEFMFTQRGDSEKTVLPLRDESGLLYEPQLDLISSGNEDLFIKPRPEDLHPVDLLHFLPRYMDNNVEEIKTVVEISVATMGQDQRHRTIRRSQPKWTGNFYLPPILGSLSLEEQALEVFNHWRDISQSLPESLSTILAPYGAMVGYEKSASYNATTHELGKRLCWCAQEEIYHLARSLREQLGEGSPLQGMFSTACVVSGKCGEGNRCCGRDMKVLKENPFPRRRV